MSRAPIKVRLTDEGREALANVVLDYGSARVASALGKVKGADVDAALDAVLAILYPRGGAAQRVAARRTQTAEVAGS